MRVSRVKKDGDCKGIAGTGNIRSGGIWTRFVIMALSVILSVFLSWLIYNRSGMFILLVAPLYVIVRRLYNSWSYNRLKKEMLVQFEEMLASLASSLQVGYSLENAFLETGRQFEIMYGKKSYISVELDAIRHGLSVNIPIETLIVQMGKRTALSEIAEYADILGIAKRSGGNFIEVTKHNADILRERRQVLSDIETVVTAKKYESMVMNIMPVGMLLYLRITSAEYISALYSGITGNVFMSILLSVYVFAAWLGGYFTDFDRGLKKVRKRKVKPVGSKVMERLYESLTGVSAGILKKGMIEKLNEKICCLDINAGGGMAVKRFWCGLAAKSIPAFIAGCALIVYACVNVPDNLLPYVITGVVISFIVPYTYINSLKTGMEERNNQMLLDYPELIDRLSLLLGAGLSMKGCFKRIASEYKLKRDRGFTGFHYAYEEMLYSARQLDSGKAETDVYEELGKRSRTLAYMKLTTMMVQNLRKGNRDMLDKFQIMSLDAMEERKAVMKRMGEKASSKLLLPMMIQFMVILAMIMYPAVVGL